MSTMDTSRQVIQGIGVSPGRAVGTVLRMPDPVPEPAADSRLGDESADDAAARIAAATDAVRGRLEQAASGASGTSKEVLETTAMMAADPTLLSTAQGLVRSAGLSPARAVWQAAGQVIDQLAAIGGYMAERTRDVADVRDRVVADLTGRPGPRPPVRPGGA
jgi:phosphotransferase system enzyme I (PtsI)